MGEGGGDDDAVPVDLISEVSGLKSDMEIGVTSAGVLDQVENYSQRLGELRNVLMVLREGRKGNNEKEGDEGGRSDAEKLIKPLFAEMILQSKETLSKEGEELQEEFEVANREAKEARIAVMKAIREDEDSHSSDFPDELEGAFEKAGFKENVEMELVKEEIMMKLREVKTEWKKAMEVLKGGGGDEDWGGGEDGGDFQTIFEKIDFNGKRSPSRGA